MYHQPPRTNRNHPQELLAKTASQDSPSVPETAAIMEMEERVEAAAMRIAREWARLENGPSIPNDAALDDLENPNFLRRLARVALEPELETGSSLAAKRNLIRSRVRAYDEGYKAFCAGVFEEDNPHRGELGKPWNDGWQKACADFSETEELK